MYLTSNTGILHSLYMLCFILLSTNPECKQEIIKHTVCFITFCTFGVKTYKNKL